MLSFIRLSRAITTGPSRGSPRPLCIGCGTRPPTQSIPSFLSSVWVELSLCEDCYRDCLEVSETADHLRNTASRSVVGHARWLPTHIIALRVALLRALPDMILYQAGSRAHPLQLCMWCGTIACPTNHTWRMAYSDDAESIFPMVTASVQTSFPLHTQCHREIAGALHETHLDLCMASCALWLPLLPELAHYIAAIVCRLTAVDLGPRAIGRCLAPLPWTV